MDGSTHRDIYYKSETAPPTILNDALLMTMLVDAWEKIHVTTADVTGAYLRVDMLDYTLLKLEGKAVDIMGKGNGDYNKLVCWKKLKKVLYLRLLKVLYGCVKPVLLWYDLFINTLKDLGFKLNPYDECVSNKVITGKQCTIT